MGLDLGPLDDGLPRLRRLISQREIISRHLSEVDAPSSNILARVDGKRGQYQDSLTGRIAPQQIAEAQRLAREWKAKTWDELKDQ